MKDLIQWQWESYRHFHRSQNNLLIHIVAVPFFLIANLALIIGVVNLNFLVSLLAIVLMAISLAAQGKGHKMEPNPSIPFSGPFNAVQRLLIEQWINFPRFVISGAWWDAWKHRESA